MPLNGDTVMKASLLGPVKEELGPSPTLEEENAILNEEEPLVILDPAPQQAETLQFIESAEQSTSPNTHFLSSHCPSVRREEFWENVEIEPYRYGPWV